MSGILLAQTGAWIVAGIIGVYVGSTPNVYSAKTGFYAMCVLVLACITLEAV